MDEKIQQEVTDILRKEQGKILAEEAHDLASMLLLARIQSKVGVLAVLSKQMYDQGPEFLTATLASITVSARNLARRYTNNPTADFSDSLAYVDKQDRIAQLATRYLSRMMAHTTTDEGVEASRDLQATFTSLPSVEGASLALHIVSASGQLVLKCLDMADEFALGHIRGEHDDR